MTKTEITILIRKILEKNNYGITIPTGFDSHESLLASGVVDSFGLFAFIHELQVAFNLKIEDREIHPGNFETLEAVTDFIYNKLQYLTALNKKT